MVRSSVWLATCLLHTIVPQGTAWDMYESLSAAASSVRHGVANSGATKSAEEKKHLRSTGRTGQVETDQTHSQTHLKSVLAAEVGIGSTGTHKTEYWGKVFVGTPPKEFSVIFDTGSGNLILPSSECTSIPCQSHEKFDPQNSKTAVQVGKLGQSLIANPQQSKEATIHFGTGKIHGQFYQDKLCLGEASACYNANFIGTDYESEMPFDQCAFDGIMGLGFKDLSMGSGFNMIDDVVSQHSLPHNQFSVYLKDRESGSEISFGGYKRSQAASEVHWAPVTQQSYWQIGIEDVTFNNKKTGLCTNCQVAVDTGTSLLAGPSDVVEQLGAKLNVDIHCGNFASLPLLGFVVGDKVLNLLPQDYIDKGAGICSLALMTLDVPPPKGPLFIFGDPFLRRFLTIYDRDGPRVGFAVANNGIRSDEAKKLIATLSDGKGSDASHESTGSGSSKSDDDDDDDDETELIKLGSHMSKRAPVEDDTDPSSAADNENSSWGSIKNGFDGSARTAKKNIQRTGMLQTTNQEEDLVTITLARTGSHR